ncbi:MAG: hypothetical protein Q8O67_04150 [Deltaproteobacteria bacterium]|nr:hypothetical protein [Deltaproteobacteria bacterium]
MLAPVLLSFLCLAADDPAPPAEAPIELPPDAPQPPTTTKPAPGAPLRLVVMDLRNDGVTPQIQRIVGDSIVVKLNAINGLEVLSSEDVRRLADLDASRQTLGCDEASCLAELANALGAEVIVYGSIGTLGRIVVVHLSIFDSASAKSIARETVQANTLEELPPLVDGAVEKLVARIPGIEHEAPASSSSSFPVLPAAGVAVGATAAIVGGVVAGLAYGTYVDAKLPAAERTEAQTRIFIGLGVATAGVVVAGGAGVAFALSE